MSIYLHAKHDYQNWKSICRCAICNGSLQYPFFAWGPTFALCLRCAQTNKDGIMSDLIHLAAIADLRDVSPNKEKGEGNAQWDCCRDRFDRDADACTGGRSSEL